MPAFVPYNTTFNASGGLYNMLNATAHSMDSVVPVLGGNMLALSLLIPVWIIIFLPLSRVNMGAAFVTSSFVCWLLSVFLVVIGLANESAFLIFTLLTILSTLVYYFMTRN